jgi:hypothetical protein
VSHFHRSDFDRNCLAYAYAVEISFQSIFLKAAFRHWFLKPFRDDCVAVFHVSWPSFVQHCLSLVALMLEQAVIQNNQQVCGLRGKLALYEFNDN